MQPACVVYIVRPILHCRTLKNKIFSWVAATNRFDFTTVLQQLIASYNSQPHRSLPDGLCPNDAGQNATRVYQHLYGDRWKRNRHMRFTLELKQRVRTMMKQGPFSKGHRLNKWSGQVYIISRRIPSRPPRYQVRQLESDTPLLGSFYREELLVVGNDAISQSIFPVKRVLRTRRSRTTGETELLVEYVSPDRYIEWIPKKLYDNGSILV